MNALLPKAVVTAFRARDSQRSLAIQAMADTALKPRFTCQHHAHCVIGRNTECQDRIARGR